MGRAHAPPPAPPEKPPALLPTSASSSPALSDQAAAALVQTSAFEPRPDNAAPNATMPSEADLARFRAQDSLQYGAFVTGHYSGTTDGILQWGARKWGLDPQLLRAVAAVESSWHMATSGPYVGIFQLSPQYHCCADLAAGSTAFNADYYGASIRSFLDGKETWLNSASGNGAPYAAGDLWGSVGAWASGRWHDAGAEAYIAKAQSALAKQPWLDPGF